MSQKLIKPCEKYIEESTPYIWMDKWWLGKCKEPGLFGWVRERLHRICPKIL